MKYPAKKMLYNLKKSSDSLKASREYDRKAEDYFIGLIHLITSKFNVVYFSVWGDDVSDFNINCDGCLRFGLRGNLNDSQIREIEKATHMKCKIVPGNEFYSEYHFEFDFEKYFGEPYE